jgi:hypothetical protein
MSFLKALDDVSSVQNEAQVHGQAVQDSSWLDFVSVIFYAGRPHPPPFLISSFSIELRHPLYFFMKFFWPLYSVIVSSAPAWCGHAYMCLFYDFGLIWVLIILPR